MLRRLAKLFGGANAIAASARTPRVSQPPEDLDALLAQPIAAINAGRKHEAIERLQALLEIHPQLADAHLMLGKLLHGEKKYEDARDSYLLASALRPNWWPPHLQLGLLDTDEGHVAEAAKPLAKAIELGAPGADVHNVLGAAYMRAGDAHAAAGCFRTALALDPELARAHSNLGVALFRHLEEYDEGEWHIARALELAPDDSAAECNLVMVLYGRGRNEDALDLANRLLVRDPKLHEARINRALVLLKKGEFAQAWTDYEARREVPENKRSDDLPWPDWDGSSLAGRTIFVSFEQGIGDEIMFASCLPEVIAAARHCFIECSPKLAPIFRRSFPAGDILARDAWRDSPAIAKTPPDCKSAIGSLPLFLRRSRAAFPAHHGYLRTDERRVKRWRARLNALPGRRKVGISWRGGVAITHRGLRSIPLQQWVPILSTPGIDFVSLQYSDLEREVEALRRSTGIQVHHWQEAIDDYDDTAALVQALDLVIAVQTAVVHLGGALGARVWALIPAIPEWRYGAEGESMAWYPSVRLIRQANSGEWAPVIETVCTELARWLAAPVD